MKISINKLKRFLVVYLLAEIFLLALHYVLLLNGNDILFEIFTFTLIASCMIGLVLFFLIISLNKKIELSMFVKMIIGALFGTLLPVVFFLYILSQLH